MVVRLNAIAAASFPGTVTVSETFAASLFVGAASEVHVELVGEVQGQRLFALSRATLQHQ